MTTLMKQMRIERRWTLEYVGNRIGTTNQAVQLIETLKRKPSYDVLCALEDLFDKTHRELLSQAEDSA